MNRVTLAPVSEEPGSNEESCSKKARHTWGKWVRKHFPQLFHNKSSSDLKLLLSVLGCPLFPVARDQVVSSSAQYIIHQFSAATGCRKLEIKNMYASGKVAMAMLDHHHEPAPAAAASPSPSVSQKGCFVIWQMEPNKWLIELSVGGHKVVAGSDGNVAWRHTPWLGAHAAKGGVRPLRRALQQSKAKHSIASMADLHGRVAIVTGASRGIGRAIATHLRSLGARLVINYTSSSSSTQADLLASDFNATSPVSVAVAVKADVSNPDEVRSLFDRAEQEFGTPAHILINCAGVSDPKYPALADTTVEDWDTMFNVNARGAFLTCREAAKRLARGAGGRIILISTSVVGAALPGYAAYAASKAAVEMMGKIVAKELKGSGITVNSVAPGPVATELFFAGKSEELVQRLVDACPMGRLGQPNDIAQVIGFLVTDAAQWVNGQVIRVNGGFVV